MHSVDNLTLVGSSHISPEFAATFDVAYEAAKPDIIALELDPDRLMLLLHPQARQGFSLKLVRQVGLTGALFSTVGEKAVRMLGKGIGTQPGTDMLHAYKRAAKDTKKVALIDQNIRITLSRLSKAITWREKLQFGKDILLGLFGKRPEELSGFDLRTVPSDELVKQLLFQVRKKYPGIYRVLVEERNEYMARMLILLMKKNPDKKILAVVGAGHIEGLIAGIKARRNQIDIPDAKKALQKKNPKDSKASKTA